MFDQILSSLQKQAMPQLMSQFGLDEKQAGGSVAAAADSVKEALGGKSFGMEDALSLFSSSNNSAGADGLLKNIGGLLQSKLTGQVGLEAGKANGVSSMLLPLITDLVSKHVGGDMKNLQSLLGGGGLANVAKGLFGKLIK